jgi:uncharacterized protein (TIGR03435 family)
MKRITLRVFVCAALANAAGAQTFEVASVKPAAPESRYSMRNGPSQIAYSRVSLQTLLTKAYGIETYQLAGPSWLEDARYDLAAKLPAGTPKDQIPQMLRALLAERFALVEHRETRELPVYALVIGRNGHKLKPSTPPEETTEQPPINRVSVASDGYPTMPPGYKGTVIGAKFPGKTTLRFRGESLPDFARFMTGELDRPVFDSTGLAGTYDFGIAWENDDVFNAFAVQLGLKLESRKLPVEMLVIDRLERVPTGN